MNACLCVTIFFFKCPAVNSVVNYATLFAHKCVNLTLMSVLPTMTLSAVQVTALNSYPSEFQANLIPFNKQTNKTSGTA